ncbi:hypothetical protein COHA_002344 [Chlorella ohadii]|uniref:THIF-type NAD/FAD binding fold domain-containing protein n=1 Tax=Chlorella ohadii TaxID=2649997 RepID=A0AAD5DUE1_9CHLO|nr:hypothetical protein COHA_002344 [Chlorella ohadii]
MAKQLLACLQAQPGARAHSRVAKNIVLAGVGSVALVDDTPCSLRPPSNFLVPADAPAGTTVAEASAATLAEMNPYVKVSVLPGTPVAALAPENLRQADLLLLCGQDASVIAQADALCREDGVAFFAGVCRGMFGWAFADLGEHTYVWEKVEERQDGSSSKTVEERTLSFPSWAAATSCSLQGASIKRLSKLYLLLRVCAKFEQQQERGPTAEDSEALAALAADVCREAGIDPAALPADQLAAYAAVEEDMPAINAVVGGVVANEVIKAVGRKGEPAVNNFFLFSLADGGQGSVERMG